MSNFKAPLTSVFWRKCVYENVFIYSYMWYLLCYFKNIQKVLPEIIWLMMKGITFSISIWYFSAVWVLVWAWMIGYMRWMTQHERAISIVQIARCSTRHTRTNYLPTIIVVNQNISLGFIVGNESYFDLLLVIKSPLIVR